MSESVTRLSAGTTLLPPRTVLHSLFVPRPETHVARVRLVVDAAGRESVTFVLPVWAPGSYKVRDFSKHVQDLVARNATIGEERSLPVEKIRKNAWRVSTQGASHVELEYSVYGFEFSVRTNHVDDRHAFLNGTNTFFAIEGELDRPQALFVTPPPGWDVACALERDPGARGGHLFLARDYDQLVDSPIEMGAFERHSFVESSVPHEVVVSGSGNRPAKQWVEDVKKIVAHEVALWGELPCPRYTFIVHLFAKGQGGLEHKDSTAIQYPRARLRKKKDYERFLSLVAHEYFHLWNGKRLRPRVLGPFDYERENYTRALWLVEGITAYYDELVLARTGLLTGERYLELQAERIHALLETPGRRRQSLEEASWDAWIKYYQRDENSVNDQVSYYDKGQLVAMLLDLELRSRTKSQKSLDSIVRFLWERFGKTGDGYPESELAALFSEVAGFDLRPFFRSYVEGTEEPVWETALATAGLDLLPPKRKKDEPVKVRLGVTTDRREGGRVEVANVLEGSPAHDGGLSARDELVALDGRRITADALDERLQDYTPGDRVTILVFRDDDLRELKVTLGDASRLPGRIVKRKDASSEQRAVYEAWLGRPWDESEPSKPGEEEASA
jgi:predicted metalloprotease with PDZ domain